MDSFKTHTTVNEDLKFIDLLPAKLRHALKRLAHADKYKGALKMYRSLKKNKDIKSRNLSDKRIRDIAADYFKLSHREFEKILNRKTRYEAVEDWDINESYDIAVHSHSEIDKLKLYKDEELIAIKTMYDELKSKSDNPLIFDITKRQIKINKDLEISGEANIQKLKSNIENLPPLKFGWGSLKKKIDYSKFGLTSNVKRLEFCQSVGFYLKNELTPDTFVDTLKGLTIYGDFKIREYITGWEAFINFVHANKDILDQTMILMNGSYHYKQTIKPWIIWTDINTYYDKLKSKEGIKGDIKANTADCVLINNTTPTALYKALASDAPLKSDDKTGKLSCGGIDWYQISFKMAKDKAKLGKLTAFFKGAYEIDQGNAELSGLKSIYQTMNAAVNWNTFEDELIMEGFFGDAIAKVKQLGGDALKNLKMAIRNILKFTGSLFKSMTKLLKKEEKKHYQYLEKLTKRILKEERLLEKTQELREKKATIPDMMNAVVKNKSAKMKYIKTVNDAYNAVTDPKSEVITFKKTSNKIKINAQSMPFLMGNVISFGILNNITNSVKTKGIGFVNDLNKTMVMGDTNLPVIKVYGNKSSADYEILTVGSVSQTDPNVGKEKIDLLKLSIKPHNEYYVVNLFMFAHMKDGITNYHKVSFKKGGSGFNYDIEGAATYTTDKITEFK